MTPYASSALLIVDVQNDFCPGGALAVPDGDRVVPVLNRCISKLSPHGVPIYASRDWHPEHTSHFATAGGRWPPHCVTDTRGAAFHPKLDLPPSAEIVTKGHQADRNGYSAFEGELADGHLFDEDLRRRGIAHLYVGGLATDYCVKHSVLDALRSGIEVTVIRDAIAGVDLEPGDASAAEDEMRAAGARFVPSFEI